MKKIAILTLNGNFNYGNKLQNYALVRYLENMGFNVKTIWYKDNIKTRIKNKIKRLIPCKLQYKRTNYFENFTRKYLNRIYYNNKIDSFNYYVVGSDQVWNSNLITFSTKYFLDFSKDKNKNIAYSASFGIKTIKEDKEKIYKDGLNNFKLISVREDKGKEIIKKLINKEVEVLVDPTLLLNTKEYDKIAKKPKCLKNNNKYILVYFLGNMPKETKEKIEKFACEKNYEIIDIHDVNSKYYVMGPSEFIYLEKNATLICTDSYHAVIFSILYNKPFIVFNRIEENTEGMETRIDSLLNRFNLLDRRYNGKIDNSVLNVNYSNVDKILKEEKRKTDNFFKNAFETERSDKIGRK